MASRREQLRKKNGRQLKSGRKKWILPVIILTAVLIAVLAGFLIWKVFSTRSTPQNVMNEYFTLLDKGKYEKMYDLLSSSAQKSMKKEAYIERNQNIYDGIEASDIQVKLKGDPSYTDGKKKAVLSYSTTMQTSADDVSFDNKMTLEKEDGTYKIDWDSTLIFPSLQEEYKVQILTETAARGSIYDRNGTMLAGQGSVSQVGIVPGKLGDNRQESIQQISKILNMTEDSINALLSASYVQDDSFVPLKDIAKGQSDLETSLLAVPGVMINDKAARVYPLGAAAGHLTGYVQSVTAEDLEKLEGKGYHENSVVGRTGIELAYEEELRAVDGVSIAIVDGDGNSIETLAFTPAQAGKDVRLTIDADMQRNAYNQFAGDPATVASMNPKTGEVLALVSTPGYDPNDFILGLSDDQWNTLNNDVNKPLTNRFYNSWVPGSSFKSIIAGIGVDTGKIDPNENKGNVGLSWQKDARWGDYYVTTLTDYGSEVNLANALIYSDNIYFAKAALDIGADTLAEKFKALGFDEDIPFELELQQSTFDDDGKMDSDIQIADTGYGQGQLLVNPVHMLSMYSMFVNQGTMIQPTLIYQETMQPKNWKEQVISADAAEIVKNDLIQVIENPQGTGASAHIDGLTMLGKTGTAEIKESQDSTDGVERGWFVCETTDDIAKPVVTAAMVEDVKSKGGSHYVTDKVRDIVAAYEQ